MKERKPRGIKLNGNASRDMCDVCMNYNCDSCTGGMNPFFLAKVEKRRNQNVCLSCGNSKCNCKSSLGYIDINKRIIQKEESDYQRKKEFRERKKSSKMNRNLKQTKRVEFYVKKPLLDEEYE